MDGPFNIAAGIPKNSMTVSLLANMRRQDKLGMKKGKREPERGLEMEKKPEGREVKTAVQLFTPQMKPTEESGRKGGRPVARMESS